MALIGAIMVGASHGQVDGYAERCSAAAGEMPIKNDRSANVSENAKGPVSFDLKIDCPCCPGARVAHARAKVGFLTLRMFTRRC